MADTTITVPADSLAAAIAGTLRGERCTCRDWTIELRADALIFVQDGIPMSDPPLTGWTRVDPPILCPRCGNQLDVYDNGGGAAPWYVNDCDCGEKLPAFYESRDKLAAGIASLRTPWHRPTERPAKIGWYPCIWAHESWLWKWNGERWVNEEGIERSLDAWLDVDPPPWVKEQTP